VGGGGVMAWDGAQGRGREGAEGVDVAFALSTFPSVTASGGDGSWTPVTIARSITEYEEWKIHQLVLTRLRVDEMTVRLAAQVAEATQGPEVGKLA